MKVVFAYIRVSTVRQGEHGSSLQEQRSAIEAYAKNRDLLIAEWFEETETAAKQGRPTFTRMLAALKRGRAHGVVIHKIDRGARNLKDWANLGELIDRGVEVHFAHESLDLNSRGGRLSADIQAVVAADFIRNLRQETRKGFYGRLKQGLYPLSAPIGYCDMGKGKAKELDPITAPLVRDAFRLYGSGQFNFDDLIDELHTRGLRNRHGGSISKNGLTTMLNNPFYVGLIHIRKTNEMFQGIHKPLISKALYDEVQAVLAGNRNRKTSKHDHLFRRLIRCVQCGNHLIGETIKGKYVYYRCHTPGCVVCIRETAIEDLLRSTYATIGLDRGEMGDLRDMVEHMKNSDNDDMAQRSTALQLQLAGCDSRLARLTDALVDGLIERELFENRKSAVLFRRRELLDQLENIGSTGLKADRVMEFLELANTAQVSYQNGLPSEKRALVAATMSNFLGSGKSPAITLKSPFQELANWRVSLCCDPYRDKPRTRARQILDIFMHGATGEQNPVVTNQKRAA
jgi:site-specific DNA recombinase